MDKVKKAIKCISCLEILESPVLLPCSHSICFKHVRDVSNESIKCEICEVDHRIPSKIGFPKNQALEEIIEANIDSLYFGKSHIEALENCNQLESVLKSVDRLESDPYEYSREEFHELRNRVYLKSEQLKMNVDQKKDELLNFLTEFEVKCGNILPCIKKQNRRKKFNKLSRKSFNNFNRVREQAKSDLKSWLNDLDGVKIDEAKWEEILRKCKITISDLKFAMKSSKNGLLMEEDQFYKSKVELFENINIDSDKSKSKNVSSVEYDDNEYYYRSYYDEEQDDDDNDGCCSDCYNNYDDYDDYNDYCGYNSNYGSDY